MKRFILVLIIVAGGLLLAGGQSIYTAFRNPDPVQMTCQEYEANRPDKEWVRLSQCTLLMPEFLYEEKSGGRMTKLFIPVASYDSYFDNEDFKVKMVLETKDANLMQLAKKMKDLDKNGNEDTLNNFVRDNIRELFPVAEVSGLVEFGIELDSKTKRELAGLSSTLSPDFVIVEDGTKPDMVVGFAMGGGGLFIGIGLVLALIRSRRQDQPN